MSLLPSFASEKNLFVLFSICNRLSVQGCLEFIVKRITKSDGEGFEHSNNFTFLSTKDEGEGLERLKLFLYFILSK